MPGGILRIGILAATGALIVGGLAIGTVLAQQAAITVASQQPQREGRGRFMEVVAAKLGVTPERLQQSFTEARQELGIQRGPRERAERRGEVRERVRGVMQRGLEIVAGELNISVEQLRSELRGSSVTAVARAHGVEPQRVATALTSEATARIDAAAGQGRITSEQATRMKQRVGDFVQRMMDGQLPSGAGRERTARAI